MKTSAVGHLFILFLAWFVLAAPAQASLVSTKEWGVYAGLAGTTWRGGNRQGENFGSNWRVTVAWREVGVELVERWESTDKQYGSMTHVITRGEQPGELRLAATNGVCANRTGKVQPDGSVLFVCTGLFKWPMHVVAPQAGAWEQHYVSLKDAEITGIKSTWHFRTESAAGPNDTRGATTADQAPPRVSTNASSAVAAVSESSSSHARSVAGWAPWLPLARQVWRREGTGDWDSYAQLLEFTWHAAPSPRMVAQRRNEHGTVSVTGDLALDEGAVPVLTEGKRRRFLYTLEPQGTLLETEQRMSFFGKSWETARSTRYWAFLPDERWGLMRNLVGYSWYEPEVPAHPTGDMFLDAGECLTFSWSPADQTVETVWRGDSFGAPAVSIHMVGRNPGELEGYTEKDFWQGGVLSRRTHPQNAQLASEQLIVPRVDDKKTREVFQLDGPNTLVRLYQTLNDGRWETRRTEKFTRETTQQKSARLRELARVAAKKASRERTRAFNRGMESTNQVLSGLQPAVDEYVEQSNRQIARSIEQARQIAAERAKAEREERARQYQADWQHAKQVLSEQEMAREARAETSRAEAADKQQRVAQSTSQQQQRRTEDARRREAAEAERRRQEEEADAERRRQEETARQERAERETLARSKQLEEALKRQEEEARNRPVAYREGITLCAPPKSGGKAWLCKGPLQSVSGVLDTQSGNVAVRQACGGGNVRDLGMVAGYRAYGCGFGIHPTDRDYPGNRDTPASLGVNHIPDRGTFYCNPTKVFAYCKDRR